MKKKTINGITLAILFVAFAMLAFSLQRAKANGLIGDVDGNGVVNMDDLRLAAKAFGSTSTSPRWNPDADINLDGKIDMKDLYIIVANFGKTA